MTGNIPGPRSALIFLGQTNGLDRLDGKFLDRTALNVEHMKIVPHIQLLGQLQLTGAVGEAGVGGAGIPLFPNTVEVFGRAGKADGPFTVADNLLGQLVLFKVVGSQGKIGGLQLHVGGQIDTDRSLARARDADKNNLGLVVLGRPGAVIVLQGKMNEIGRASCRERV